MARRLILAAFVSFLWALPGNAAWAFPAEKFQVLALLPLSGPEAHQGLMAREAMQLAIEDPDVSDLLSLNFEDSQTETAKAISAYRASHGRLSLTAVITIGSPTALALMPLANADRVLLFAIAANPAYSSLNGYTFRLIGSAKTETEFLVQSIKRYFLGKPVAVIWQENDYGVGTARAFLQRATLAGLPIVYQESFLPKTADFRSQLAKLKAKSPKVLYLASWAEDAGIFVRQAREMGMKSAVFCSQACSNADLFKASAGKAEGMIVSSPHDDILKAVQEEFQSRYHEEMTYVATRNYLLMRTLAAGAGACGPAPSKADCIREFLRADSGREGSGRLAFGADGEIREHYLLLSAQGGKFAPWEVRPSE
jgi:ABC-type branched-subunit amino acid transport system substrate-binding protein